MTEVSDVDVDETDETDDVEGIDEIDDVDAANDGTDDAADRDDDRTDRPRRTGGPTRGRASNPVRKWLRSLRPAPSERLEDLEPNARIAYWVMLAGVALLPLLSALIVLRQGWRPMGDNALIGLRVHDVLTGHFPLIGQPTTGENFGSGVVTSHPGPIEFYLVAPFVLVLGPIVGLIIGAAVINSFAMVGIAWSAFRRGGLGLMFVSVLATVAMTRSLGGNLLHDPVSSNVGALMALLLMFLGWSIIAGDVKVAPLFVFVGTFALQDHLTYLGTGTPVVLLAIGTGLWWARRVQRRSKRPEQLRRPMRWALGIGLVLWFPVLFDEFFGDHNLTAIYKTFTGKRTAGEGVMFAFKRLGDAMAPWPMFARRFGPLGYLHTPNTRELVTGYAIFLLIIGLGVYFAWRKRTDLAALSVVVLVSAFAGAYSAVKLPEGAGIQASNLRWMWTVSAFAWVAMAWLVWEALKPAWRKFLGMPVIALGGLCMLLVLSGVLSTMELKTDRDGRVMHHTTALVDEVRAKLPKGTYRVKFDGGPVVVTVGPAIVHKLDHAGYSLKADLGPVSRAYASHRMWKEGDVVDGTVLMTTKGGQTYPRGTKMVGREVFDDLNRRDSKGGEVVRVFLIDEG